MQDLTQRFIISNILRTLRVSFVSSVSKERLLSLTSKSGIRMGYRKLRVSYSIFPIFARLSQERFWNRRALTKYFIGFLKMARPTYIN